MTEVSSTRKRRRDAGWRSGGVVAGRYAGGGDAGGRHGRWAVVYTPILPLMEHQAGLTATMASNLATANYVGYSVGALIGIFVPSLARSRLAARVSLLVVIATLALMPVTEDASAWLALRLVTGVASACCSLSRQARCSLACTGERQHLVGWGFGGVGLGIALSGRCAHLAVVRVAVVGDMAGGVVGRGGPGGGA